MNQTTHTSADLEQIYRTRFAGKSEYRQRTWTELCSFFSQWIKTDSTVLDLGCGHCEFINNVRCSQKFAMDLNPDAERLASSEVSVLKQDCSLAWPVPPESLDVVFTSNFFEHLPTKEALEKTLVEAYKALRSGGRLIAIGPNIKHLPGAYWDFFDHYLPLTELSLMEVLRKCGFEVVFCRDRFLPYTMSDGREYPTWMLRLYLKMPFAWPFFGKQFLVIARKNI
jgi:SAM-dependent methyltransferase